MPFLCLPAELRIEIYNMVLDIEMAYSQPPQLPDPLEFLPSVPEAMSKTDTFSVVEDRYSWCHRRSGHIHRLESQVSPKSNCSSLLWCNHQIASEVEDLITRRKLDTYNLDIVIWLGGFHSWRMFPVWIHIPVPLRYLKRIDFNLTLYDENFT